MRKIILLLLCLIAIDSFAAGTESVIKAHEQGDRDSSNLTNIIAKIGNKAVRIDIDAGDWTITNNVIFPTNTALFIYPGSYLDVAVGSTVTVNGVLLPGPWEIVRGGGIGNGDATFLYEYSQWSTGDVDFGTAILVPSSNTVNTTNSFTMSSGTTAYVDRLEADYIDADNIYSRGYSLSPGTNMIISWNTNNTSGDMQVDIDNCNKWIPEGVEYVFKFSDGDYVLTNQLKWSGFFGGGFLRVYGNTNEAYTNRYTTQSVDIACGIITNQHVLLFDECSCEAVVQNIKIGGALKTDDVGLIASKGESCMVKVQGCYLTNSTTDGGGFFAEEGEGFVFWTYFTKFHGGIFANGFSNVRSQENLYLNTQPLYGLVAQWGGYIAKQTTNQPTGSIADEYTEGGGTIK